MEKLDRLFEGLKDIHDPAKKRAEAFYFVRNIPYGTIGSHSINDALQYGIANCHAKSELLKLIFTKLGYDTRTIVLQYVLKDYPLEVRFIPGQIDYHYVAQVYLHEEWVSVDVTYDPPLKALGFLVNEWDGNTSTSIAEKSLVQKVEGQPDARFDKDRQESDVLLRNAYRKHADDISKYQTKFNDWLAQSRA